MVVVDGRTSANLGVTAQQSAEIMRELGAYQAVNLDGGGSSTMVVVENGKVVLKNRPGNPGGVERAVGSVILAYEK
jgi:exopolysaccharide biosynthesis protein